MVRAKLTICSFTVFPSSSIVRIFCAQRQRWSFHVVIWEGKASYEVDTNGRDVRLGVGVVGETEQQARLSNTGVTDEEELEEVIVSSIALVERVASFCGQSIHLFRSAV